MSEDKNQNPEESQETPENTPANGTPESEKVDTPETETSAKSESEAPEKAENQPEKTEASDEKAVDDKKEAAEDESPKAAKEDEKADETAEEASDEDKKEAEEPAKEPEPEVPHDEFDWDTGNRAGSNYEKDEFKRMEKVYSDTLTFIEDNEIVKGKVTRISEGDVVLDLNYKSNGVVPLAEFRDNPDLAPGDTVSVYVEQLEDEKGQLILSRRKAKLLGAWDAIVDSYKNDTIIKGTVVSKTKGGLIADCGGLETFLPGSQIDIKPIVDYDAYVGKTMEFKVVKINESIKNAVVSHKALIESDLAEQREEIIAGLEKGQVLEGTVKILTDFGAFLDLGGVDGLLYITDISWGRISHPSEVLSLNDQINVVVLDFDENKKRISLGLKQLQPHPWEVLDESIQEGSNVSGRIVNIEDYGAFLEIMPGVEGLIHVSEVSWSNQPVNARDFFDLGQEFEAKIVTIDTEDRKMSLSIKQLQKDPWEEIGIKYPVNSRHEGEVKNLTPYGVFVELEEGIGGMIHISDLSWTKRYNDPSEFTRVGETIEVVVLEIDNEDRKMSLGHKQLEENPWDTFENVFPVGSYHDATILRKDDRGAIVQLPYGLEAFAPIKHIKKENGQMADVDEVLTMKVLEFNRDDKRILVSHLRYLQDIKREADDKVREEKQEERKETQKTIKKQSSKMERSTMGELDAFSQLKDQLEGNQDQGQQEEE